MFEQNRRFLGGSGLALAILVAVSALGGIALPSTYAQETATWAAQGIGQDWVNLLLVTPWMALSAWGAQRGSRRATLLLGGALIYCVYSYLFYAFAVHFNTLFLVYCAALGLSTFALVALGLGLARGDARALYDERLPRRLVGGTLVGLAALFAAMWLSEVIPALLRGSAPPSTIEAGLFTNPVHVLDLSLVLPAMAVAGVSLLRGGALGAALAPLLLGFSVLMTAAIGGMVVVMWQRGVTAEPAMAGVFAVVAAATAAELAWLLRTLRS